MNVRTWYWFDEWSWNRVPVFIQFCMLVCTEILLIFNHILCQ